MNPWDLVWTGAGWACVVAGGSLILAVLGNVVLHLVVKPAIAGVERARHELQHWQTRDLPPEAGQVWRTRDGSIVWVQEVRPRQEDGAEPFVRIRTGTRRGKGDATLTLDAWRLIVDHQRMALRPRLAKRGRV